ncbi:MAG: tetratricopeptide repeat protein [Kofleriaceae bacterium]|jgi:tetratricopeptide (TPR) repeat protein|nr:tetratricopeptide repeat protein [Kofleriaceae bacterium]
MRTLTTTRWVLGLAFGLGLASAACGGSSGTRRLQSGMKPTAPKLDPVKPAAMREYEAAMRAMRLGGPEAAQTAKARLQAAVEIDKSLWEAWHNLGVIETGEGNEDAAAAAFGKALAVNPANTPSRLARAEAYRRAGSTKDARSDYEVTLRELDSDDPLRKDAAARYASLLRDAGQYEPAIDVLRDTLRVSGASSRIYTELGLIYIAQKRLDLATLVLSRAKELDAKDPAVYNAQAILALRLGKGQEAFERFEYASSLDPRYHDARFNKAAVLLDAGDYQRAKAELSTIVEQKPDDLAAQVALGVAMRGLKDYPAARATWERVIKNGARRDPNRADALFNLALLKADFLEDVAGGKAELERYLQDAPSGHAKRQAADEKKKELGL